MKRKSITLSVIIGIGIILLTGCGNGSASEPMENITISDTVMPPEESQEETEAEQAEEAEEEPELKESENQEELEDEADDAPIEIPQLSGTGGQLVDFVPDGWELLDSVELDFNEDGIPDYVGVLEIIPIQMDGYVIVPDYPRILFAIASDGTEGYRLDFQDINLIGKGSLYSEGNNWPLTAEGTSFTTHRTSGKVWNGSEDYTYTYREGIWWLTSSEEISGYGEYVGEYITSYSKNDWESGVGIRRKRSTDWDDIEENWGSEEYDAVYELVLDEPLTLEQAGMRSLFATDRVTDWEVEEISFAADVELSEDKIKHPDEAWLDYNDENCVLYTFHPDSDTDEAFYYLAMYCWQDKVLSVLAQEKSAIDDLEFYKGKIYYSTELVENVVYKTTEDGKEQTVEEEDTVGIRLNRMEPDGIGKETIFEYRYPGTEQEIMESEVRIPYFWLSCEISGNEIVAEIHVRAETNPIYRMNTDGSECKKIGQLPKE